MNMVLTRIEQKISKTGIPLAEMNRNVGDHNRQKPLFVPAEQVAQIQLLTEILEELKKINQKMA